MLLVWLEWLLLLLRRLPLPHPAAAGWQAGAPEGQVALGGVCSIAQHSVGDACRQRAGRGRLGRRLGQRSAQGHHAGRMADDGETRGSKQPAQSKLKKKKSAAQDGAGWGTLTAGAADKDGRHDPDAEGAVSVDGDVDDRGGCRLGPAAATRGRAEGCVRAHMYTYPGQGAGDAAVRRCAALWRAAAWGGAALPCPSCPARPSIVTWASGRGAPRRPAPCPSHSRPPPSGCTAARS